MSEGLEQFGAGYIVRLYDGDGNLRTTSVQTVYRLPDGSERLGNVVNEPIEFPFTTLEEAVDLAVQMTLEGQEVGLSRGIDGRSGARYSQEKLVDADVLGLLVLTTASTAGREAQERKDGDRS